MAKFALRFAQLDLARQMESLEFIEETLSLFSKAGYNGVLLYLEDRISTPSYNLPEPNECYTAEEIRRLVKYAENLQMELVPCVATLGHAERFLRHEELKKFAEVTGEIKGRFGGTAQNTFCINKEGFYEFMGSYLKEVASLFPSRYFHIGLDEFWDYNLCPDCRKKMTNLMEEQKGFLEHILKIRKILADCGKEVMMWSDMFEQYAEIYKDVPSDVIMVDWQYQMDVRNYMGHLLDVAVEDRIRVNTANGHKTIVAPADMILENSQSYFEYADGREGVIGGLVTSWEKNDTFLYRSFPIFLSAGFQMNGMEREEAFAAGMELLTSCKDPIFISAVKTALNAGWNRHFGGIADCRYLVCDFYGEDPLPESACKTVLHILKSYEGKFDTILAVRFLKDLTVSMEEKLLAMKGKRIVREILDKGADKTRLERFAAFRSNYSRILDQLEEMWEEYRRGITPNVFTEVRSNVESRLLALEKKLESNSFLAIGFCLPDYYGIEKLEVEYKINGKWYSAGKGVFKAGSTAALFSRFFPIEKERGKVEALRLTASGMGGVGLTFAECNMDGIRYIPESIGSVSGQVRDAHYLLQNDSCFAWFGGQCTRNDYFDLHAANARHSILLNMKEESGNDLVFVKE